MVDKKNKTFEYWRNYLENINIRQTPQRLLLLKTLLKNKIPMTAQQIYSEMEKKLPDIRLSTVYRNLNIFTEKNITMRIELNIEKKENYYELEGYHHHHLICVSCGQILSLDCPLEGYEEEIMHKTKYSIIEHRIKIYGICPECKDSLPFKNNEL